MKLKPTLIYKGHETIYSLSISYELNTNDSYKITMLLLPMHSFISYDLHVYIDKKLRCRGCTTYIRFGTRRIKLLYSFLLDDMTFYN